MKKLFFAVMSVALFTAGVSFAEESYVAGGFEASGHAFFGSGWQRYKTGGPAIAVARDVNGTTAGQIGEYATGARVNGEDEFKFFLDEVEVDLAKTFGENIRLRADVDFGAQSMNSGPRFANAGGVAAGVGDDAGILLEQAYGTVNLGVGNGIELLLGRFNAPIGFESVDVGENDTVSRSIVYRALRPRTFTGAKVYYSFSDLIDFHFFVANQGLSHDDGDVLDQNIDFPSLGFRLGFNWGEEGKQNHFGWSGAFGQDHANLKQAYTFLGDADWKWWVTDSFALGGEGIYRQIDTNVAGRRNGKYYGALLNLHYDFSDVWDGTLRYSHAHDVNGAADLLSSATGLLQSLTGADQLVHEIALAGNYAITDGATLKLEGGYTVLNPAGAGNNRYVFGIVGGFAYAF